MFQNTISVVSNLLTETNTPGWEYQEQVLLLYIIQWFT